MLVVMRFIHDLDVMARARLAEHGYQGQARDNAASRFALLMTHLERLIPQQKYNVHISREAASRQLTKPSRQALNEIVRRLKKGASLKPYLSKRVKTPEVSDGLLLSWSILHLHLNPISSMNDTGFVARSDTLLMLRIEQDQAYLVDILPHSEKDLFVDTRLLQIIDRNWPKLLTGAPGLSAEPHTPTAIKMLRKRNVNHTIAMENRVIFPNMLSAAGIPMHTQRQYDALCFELEHVERDARQRIYEYFPAPLRALPTLPFIQHIKLTAIEDDFFLLENQATHQKCMARRTLFRN